MEQGHRCTSTRPPSRPAPRAGGLPARRQVRLAQQPAWPFEYAITPGTAAAQIDLDATRVVDLGQGAQFGHLPEPARNQLGS